MKVVTADIYDILGDEPAVALKPHHYVRFRGEGHRWIDVEVRDGRVMVRGSTSFIVRPHSANQVTIEIDT